MPATELSSWDVERRDDETVLVRVHSSNRQGRPLPDAVFAFRYGDPQYDYWASQLLDRMRNQTQMRSRRAVGRFPRRDGRPRRPCCPAPLDTAAFP